MGQNLRGFLSDNPGLVSLVAALYLYGIYAVSEKSVIAPGSFPEGSSLQIMLLSGTGLFYLVLTGLYLIHRGRSLEPVSGDLRDNIPLIWGGAFVLYGIVMLGVLLDALGLYTESLPSKFFLTRQFMIIWAAAIGYGLVKFRMRSGFYRRLVPGTILLAGYSWFAWGLLVQKSIEYTMYGFTSFIWVPVTFTFAYLFWKYSRGTGKRGLRWLSAGMAFMGGTYILWAPTHTSRLYLAAFALYDIALGLILVGVTNVPWEKMEEVDTPFEFIDS
ncbi:MAG: hypothetical protein ABEK01_05305 [Candidatus Nanohaloarchaea archaeon]